MTTLNSKPQSGMRGSVKRHLVASFFVLAYAITWLAWLPDILAIGAILARYS